MSFDTYSRYHDPIQETDLPIAPLEPPPKLSPAIQDFRQKYNLQPPQAAEQAAAIEASALLEGKIKHVFQLHKKEFVSQLALLEHQILTQVFSQGDPGSQVNAGAQVEIGPSAQMVRFENQVASDTTSQASAPMTIGSQSEVALARAATIGSLASEYRGMMITPSDPCFDASKAREAVEASKSRKLQEFNRLVGKEKSGLQRLALLLQNQNPRCLLHRLTGPTRQSLNRLQCLSDDMRMTLRWFLESSRVTAIIICFILGDAAFRAIESDQSIKNNIEAWSVASKLNSTEVHIKDRPVSFTYLDWSFAIIFTIELVLRLVTYSFEFLLGPDVYWNLLDCMIVLFDWLDLLVFSIASDGKESFGGVEMDTLRLLRLARAGRSVRLLRAVRFFKELRLIMLSLMHSVKPLFWSCVCFSCIILIFANIFLELICLVISSSNPADEYGTWVHWSSIFIKSFPSFLHTLTSLLGIALGGVEWLDIYMAFYHATGLGAALFLIYVIVTLLGVLNVITAVFVEAAMGKAKKDRQLTLLDEQDLRRKMAKELVGIFKSIDTDKTGTITYDEWSAFLDTEAGREFLVLFDVQAHQAQIMHQLCDTLGSGQLDLDEFVLVFLGFGKAVKKMDMQFSAQLNKYSTRQLLRHTDDIAKRLEQVDWHIMQIHSVMALNTKIYDRLEKVDERINQNQMHPTQIRTSPTELKDCKLTLLTDIDVHLMHFLEGK